MYVWNEYIINNWKKGKNKRKQDLSAVPCNAHMRGCHQNVNAVN